MRTNIKLLILCSFIIQIYRVDAQVYRNSEGELVCISADTIFFKLSNRDAFGTFGIGRGFIAPNESSFHIKKLLSVNQHTSSVSKMKVMHSGISITVLDYESRPMEFSVVSIKNRENGKIYFKGNCDKEGVILLNKRQLEKLKNVNIEISIESVGFFATHHLVLDPGNKYTIISLVSYPFSIINEKQNVDFKFLEGNRLLVNFNSSTTMLELENAVTEIDCDFFHFRK
jgi:hypothetical protein